VISRAGARSAPPSATSACQSAMVPQSRPRAPFAATAALPGRMRSRYASSPRAGLGAASGSKAVSATSAGRRKSISAGQRESNSTSHATPCASPARAASRPAARHAPAAPGATMIRASGPRQRTPCPGRTSRGRGSNWATARSSSPSEVIMGMRCLLAVSCQRCSGISKDLVSVPGPGGFVSGIRSQARG